MKISFKKKLASVGIGMETGIITILSAVISEISTSISYGFFTGGIIGLGIGAVIGIIIAGSIIFYKNSKKTEDFRLLVRNCKIQYEEIYSGICHKINLKKSELRSTIENTNNSIKKFLNENMVNIPKEKWDNAKNEFYNLTKEFEKIFSMANKNDDGKKKENLLAYSYHNILK